MIRLLTIVGLAFVPQLVFASVEISEIAWMGSEDSVNHEWIELHNTGSTVDLDGWILHDANNLTIELAGTLQAGSHAVLERTSDASAPGGAFMLYAGALSNAGATLVLRDASGVVVDQVNGGDGWENIGGNNETKDTAQRTNVGWQTAPATPGVAAVNGATQTTVEDDPESASPTTNGSIGASSRTDTPTRLVLPDISLQLAIDAPVKAHVGQQINFTVTPSGVGDTIADSLVYNWSLGNGEAVSGKDISYTYQHPGTYVVVAAGEYKRQKQWQRHEIKVLPVELQLRMTDDMYVIANVSNQEIDIGGYRLKGIGDHVFPKHTIILPNTEIIVPFGLSSSVPVLGVLYDQSDVLIATHVPDMTQEERFGSQLAAATARPVVTAVAGRAAASPPPSPPTQQFGFASDPPAVTQPIEMPVVAPIPVATQNKVPAAPTPDTAQPWPLIGLVTLLLVGTIGIF